MTSTNELFRDDYNLEALQRGRPLDQDFEMLVTPRFTAHYLERSYEPFTTTVLRQICKRKQLFLDVGAHFGFFTLVAGTANPDLRIVALEPIPESHAILRQNLQLNGLSTTRCLQAAASDRSGKAQFHRSIAADNCSFYTHPQAPSREKLEIETVELGSILAELDGSSVLIKIDAEGHEIPILEGLGSVLSEHQDMTLIVELNPVMQRQAGRQPQDLLSTLEEIGFSSFLLDDSAHRAYRIRATSRWDSLVEPDGYANLYCRREESALSICFFSHASGLAGAERSLLELAEQVLVEHGAICNVVVPQGGALEQKLREVGTGVLGAAYGWWCDRVPLSESQASRRLGKDLLSLLSELMPEIERIDPDLICTNSLVIPYGALAATWLNKPHIWNLHEYGERYHQLHFFLPFEDVLQFVRAHSNALFCASKTLCRALFPDLDTPVCDSLYPAISVPFTPLAAELAADWFGSAEVRIGEFATVTETKQQEIAIRAVAELIAEGLKPALLIAGSQDTDYAKTLEELIESLGVQEQVRLVGFIEDVYSAMAATDILVASAAHHAFGRVVAEGMMLAKAVVYPSDSGVAECMEDGVTGLSYEPGSPEDLARALRLLVTDAELRSRLGNAARKIAKKTFTKEQYAGKFSRKASSLRGEVSAGDRMHRLLGEALRSALDQTLEKLQQLETEMTDSRHQLAAQSQELASLREVLSAREEELAAIKPVLEARDQELAAIKPVLEARDQELAAIKPVLQDREEALAALQSTFETRSGELAAAESTLEARDEEIEKLRSLLTSTQNRLDRLRDSWLGRLALRRSRSS